ncbi:putative ABC transport system permease protein [Lutibacter flavus]|uniref:Putative ABC transport system permease protein n=2 Tax=Lutibacter flavus TaxID=691689 RepID=A0A238VNQ9_9FLAO|nr:FtsX-like permease family protein [Lutibacter flavus]SNR35393.1 putative ABC transport system permease protein [Lutibacter flavus]
MSKLPSKTSVKWLFKMAWRDGKASISRLMLFMASIILGIAAVVSIQLFSDNLKQNIKNQSKALMGADFIIDSRQLPTKKVQAIIDSLNVAASEVNFVSMAAFPKNDGTKLVKVRAIEGNFPFYGTLDTEPVNAASIYQELGGALVDATLMLQFNIKPGDSIKLGKQTFPIIGALKSIPGSTAFSSSVAPTVLIPFRFVDDTELLQLGSRKEYQYFFIAPPTMDLDLLDKKIDPVLDDENADLDTHTSTSERLGRRYDNVSRFLNLAAFIALLLGCVGIASSVHIYIKEKLQNVAVLKCLGATRKQTFLIYLLQVVGIGLIGGVLGAVIGIGLQYAFPYILQGFLPFDVQIAITVQPLIIGITLGVLMSVLFALLPLLGTWYVSPLEVLRGTDENLVKPRKARLFTFAAILLFVFLFSFWLLKDAIFGLVFTVGILITFSIMAGIASLFMKAIKKYFPSNWGFTKRQSLLNLFRPNNQTMVLILAIGLGTFLISTLYFTKDILLAKTSIENNKDNANIILMDVQNTQKEAVINTVLPKGLEIIDNIPIVTMRLHQIKDQLVNDIRKDTASTMNQWILNHEFRVTYRKSLLASEEILEGNWSSAVEEGKPILISISDNIARDAALEIGDQLIFNVQGVLMETIIGSIRKVDWGRMQLNFSVVFPTGVLENAPQFNVLTTYVSDEASSADLQRDLVKKFPNISVLDLRQVYTLIEDILNKISWIINFMAFFSILTGIIVLIGSVRNSKYQRIKESVLLRTLGAKSKQILQITALEYIYLGMLGSLVGILLSLISSQLLAVFLFKEPFIPSVVPFLVFLPGITMLVLLIGLSNIRSVLKSPPLEVLRREV